MISQRKDVEVIAIGASSGGIEAVIAVLKALPASFPIPIVVVLHRRKNVSSELLSVLQRSVAIPTKEADDKELIKGPGVFVAPANYHLLIEDDRTFALDCSEAVNYSRPSINLTFDCVARVYHGKAVGILLTGANADGAEGLLQIKVSGSTCYVQDPKTAVSKTMPKAAIRIGAASKIITLTDLTLTLEQFL